MPTSAWSSAAATAGAFAAAGTALFNLVCDVEAVEERERFELADTADGIEAPFVDWLNDLVFLFEEEESSAAASRSPSGRRPPTAPRPTERRPTPTATACATLSRRRPTTVSASGVRQRGWKPPLFLTSTTLDDLDQDPVVRQLREQISDNDLVIVNAINKRLGLVRRLRDYKAARGGTSSTRRVRTGCWPTSPGPTRAAVRRRAA